jgi:hypothetical protein
VCRRLGYREKRRQAKQRYKQTPKGRQSRRDAERKRRQRKKWPTEISVGDNTSMPVFIRDIDLLNQWLQKIFEPKRGYGPPRCRFCGCFGRVVAQFERRGYT